ncbi:oleate hydratase [Bradyrhizobium barranii]|uniref:oleate hydratase n=1 Tax=Bradyrhizobium TaxID=374 RepID=UPI003F277F6C
MPSAPVIAPPPQAAPRRTYLVGTGIAALAAAAYLIKEGGLMGPSVVLFGETAHFGGSLDATGNPKDDDASRAAGEGGGGHRY